jgi:integrase
MTYAKHDGREHKGIDAQGRDIWRLRGSVDGVSFDERFHGTKTAAGRELTNLRKAASEGSLANDKGMSVEAFYARYIEHRIATGELREGKVATTYRSYVRRHIAPMLPSKLADVRTRHAQEIPDAMIAAGVTASTPQVKAVCVGGFKQALRWGLIPLNPFDGVSWPRVKRPERPSLSPEQVVAIIEKADEEYRIPLALDATIGLRASELSGLRWSDVNFKGGTCADRSSCPSYPHLHVDGGIQRVNGTLVRTEPKTKRGRRWVPLAASAVSMLRKHRVEQAERQLLLGQAWKDDDLVIEQGDGGPLDPNLLGKAFMRSARRAKFRGFHFHDLRHYFVTQAVNSDIDAATVSRMAGHSSVAFTLQVYFHPSETTAAPLAESIDAALGEALASL